MPGTVYPEESINTVNNNTLPEMLSPVTVHMPAEPLDTPDGREEEEGDSEVYYHHHPMRPASLGPAAGDADVTGARRYVGSAADTTRVVSKSNRASPPQGSSGRDDMYPTEAHDNPPAGSSGESGKPGKGRHASPTARLYDCSEDGDMYNDDDDDDDDDDARGTRDDENKAGPASHSGTNTTTNTATAEEEDEEARFNETERQAREALEAIVMRDASVESDMAGYVRTLRGYRLACENRRMYREAHLVQQVLRNLRLEDETRHVRGLTALQVSERHGLEESHRQEFRHFHRHWNERIDRFEEEQLEMEVTLLERQNDELLAFHAEMRDYDPRGVPRFSRRLLAARQRQQALARQKRYAAAQEEKDRGDALEGIDMERYEAMRLQMYERKEFALQQHHQQELLALRLRVEGRRLLTEKARKKELDEVLQRYLNARNEMETAQNIVRNRTGALLLKHACNGKSDGSGSAALVESACSGAFGPVIKERARAEMQRNTASSKFLLSAASYSVNPAAATTSDSNTNSSSSTAPSLNNSRSGRAGAGGGGSGLAVEGYAAEL